MKKDTPEKPKVHHVPTVSARLPDGRLVEMLVRLSEGESVFVVAFGEDVQEVRRVARPGGGFLVPYSPRNNLLVHKVVLFPTEVGDFQAVVVLRAEVQGFIHRYVDLSADFELLATHYVLLTWLFDDFSELPYLRVQGDYGTGKSRFLQTVGSLVYKPIFASGASSVSPLFRILDSVGGTLIVDEADFRFSDEKADIIKILNNGNSKGFPVLRTESTPQGEFNPRAFDVYGPKLIATRSPFEDHALESRCLTEIMHGGMVREDVPLNLPPRFHAEATALRNKLLLFRLQNAGTTDDLDTYADRGLEPRVAQLFTPLLSVAGDHASRVLLKRLASRYSSRTRGNRKQALPRKVLVLLSEFLSEKRSPVAVGALTERFNTRHDLTVSPRWMGALLRRELGLSTRKTAGVYQIPVSEFAQVDELVRRYDVGDVGDVPGGGAHDAEPSQ